MTLLKNIAILKLASISLFFFALIGIVGSLFLHNFLVNFNFEPKVNELTYLEDVPGKQQFWDCEDTNAYCTTQQPKKYSMSSKIFKIDDCFTNLHSLTFFVDGLALTTKSPKIDLLTYIDGKFTLQKKFAKKKIQLRTLVLKQKNKTCIKNYSLQYFFYKHFPPFTLLLDNTYVLINNTLVLGSSKSVNPFLYGEVSISNLVKRYPINYFFKFCLYLAVLSMLIYWVNYNKIFKNIISKKNNGFYFFGMASAILLFIHVFYLGTTSNNEILKNLRRIVIVLFVIFEVVAQTWLTISIYKNKKLLSKYIKESILLTKIIFVSIISVSTVMIILFLLSFDLDSSVDYILEWNYFVILLIFYFFSFLIWKKNN